MLPLFFRKFYNPYSEREMIIMVHDKIKRAKGRLALGIILAPESRKTELVDAWIKIVKLEKEENWDELDRILKD